MHTINHEEFQCTFCKQTRQRGVRADIGSTNTICAECISTAVPSLIDDRKNRAHIARLEAELAQLKTKLSDSDDA